jgi:ATP-dependent RNA helicase UAP56/SUB2
MAKWTKLKGKLYNLPRLKVYQQFKDYEARILISTEIFGRGVDFQGVNIVINYDMASGSDDYLHRVGRAGRFGTKGLSISFIATEEDEKILSETQERFEVKIEPLPETIDSSYYMNN